MMFVQKEIDDNSAWIPVRLLKKNALKRTSWPDPSTIKPMYGITDPNTGKWTSQALPQNLQKLWDLYSLRQFMPADYPELDRWYPKPDQPRPSKGTKRYIILNSELYSDEEEWLDEDTVPNGD
jgi:hypothetical protein